MSETIYHDIAVLAGDRTDDAWEAMAESYDLVARMLIAVLQHGGPRRLPADWLELAQGFVMTADPLRDGTVRLAAVRRGEVKSDTMEGAARLSEKWHRMYQRREPSR